MLVCGLVGETGQHGQHPLGLKLMGVIYKIVINFPWDSQKI